MGDPLPAPSCLTCSHRDSRGTYRFEPLPTTYVLSNHGCISLCGHNEARRRRLDSQGAVQFSPTPTTVPGLSIHIASSSIPRPPRSEFPKPQAEADEKRKNEQKSGNYSSRCDLIWIVRSRGTPGPSPALPRFRGGGWDHGS